MSEKDIIFLVALALGFVAGYSVGHLRGQCVGIAWSMKNRDELRNSAVSAGAPLNEPSAPAYSELEPDERR